MVLPHEKSSAILLSLNIRVNKDFLLQQKFKNSDFELHRVSIKSQDLLPPHLLKILLMTSDLMTTDLMTDLFYLTGTPLPCYQNLIVYELSGSFTCA